MITRRDFAILVLLLDWVLVSALVAVGLVLLIFAYPTVLLLLGSTLWAIWEVRQQ